MQANTELMSCEVERLYALIIKHRQHPLSVSEIQEAWAYLKRLPEESKDGWCKTTTIRRFEKAICG